MFYKNFSFQIQEQEDSHKMESSTVTNIEAFTVLLQIQKKDRYQIFSEEP